MVKIKIDNREVEVAPGTSVLQAALANKIDLPYFCYHPKLPVDGNCRMCMVQIKGQNKPAISCRTPVAEGMEVDTKTPEVKKLQQSVLEFILRNHPLDCPICDQSGECDLQDNYYKFSKFPSRLEDEKIHKPKVVPLGPYVTLDDERCILCSRCIRFCDGVAKEHELCFEGRGGHTVLRTFPGKELKNPYSLCTVDICPVGALTSTDFRFKKRVWFLKTTESICTGCATGCNIKIDWDDQKVYRYRPRENNEVNETWMCDAGRMTYKFINDENRALDPLVKKQGAFVKASWQEALREVVNGLDKTVPVVGVVSAQASCEENQALVAFLKNHFTDLHWIATKQEVAHPTHDEFLIDADKNPNSKFLSELGKELKFSKTFPEGAICFVLDHLTESQKQELVSAEPRKIIWLTSNLWEPFDSLARSESALAKVRGSVLPLLPDNPRWADIILPKPTFVEQEGTFINRKGLRQKANKAFEPRGHSKPVWEIFKELEDLMRL